MPRLTFLPCSTFVLTVTVYTMPYLDATSFNCASSTVLKSLRKNRTRKCVLLMSSCLFSPLRALKKRFYLWYGSMRRGKYDYGKMTPLNASVAACACSGLEKLT